MRCCLGQHADARRLFRFGVISAACRRSTKPIERLARSGAVTVAGVVLNGAGVDVRDKRSQTSCRHRRLNEHQLEQAASTVAAATQAAADTADDVFEAAPDVIDADTEVATEPGFANDENV